MISPMPFWPSLPPWKNETPVQVKIKMPRIHQGGGAALLGSWYRVGALTKDFITTSSSAEKTKPISGDSKSAWKTFSACPQSTPEVACPDLAINWLARPTPIIEPISAWEEELGMPTAQVARFHTMAA